MPKSGLTRAAWRGLVKYQSKQIRKAMVTRKRKPKAPRSIDRSITKFKRTFLLASWDVGTSNVSQALSFNLSQVPSYTNFTQLYDMYRITYVVLKFVVKHNVSDMTGGASDLIPIVHSAPDYNDAFAPASIAALLNQGGYKRKRLIGPQTYKVKPSTLIATSGGSFNTPKWRDWQSTASPTIPHYGYKFFVENAAASASVNVDIYCTMYFQTKDPKSA